MDTSKSITLMFVGSIMLYLAFFGLTSPLRLTLTGEFVIRTDWNDLTGWSVVEPEAIIESGWLRLASSGSWAGAWAYEGKVWTRPTLPQQLTLETKLKLASADARGRAVIDVYDGNGYRYGLVIGTTQIWIPHETATPITLNTQLNTEYVWRVLVDSTVGAQKMTVYRNAIKVGESSPQPTPDKNYITHRSWGDSLGGTVVYFDYTYVVKGLVPPSETPPSKGTLRVFTTYQVGYISTSVLITGPETKTGITTTDANNPLKFDLTPGTYTVSGTYSGIQQSATATVTAGQTSDAVLNFGGTPPTPPPDGEDILQKIIAKINEIFRNPTVQTLLTLSGIGCLGIGFIGLVLPKRKHYPSPPSISLA